MKIQRSLIAAGAAAFALAPAASIAEAAGPTANAAGLGHKIVLFKSIGGIGFGLTPAQVRHKLGKPSHTIKVHGKVAEYDYNSGFNSIINVQFDTLTKGDPSDGVFGFASRFHTSKGIHVGSSLKHLKRAYGSKLKHEGDLYTMWNATPGSIGSTTTQFAIEGGKVNLIDIQHVDG